MIDDPQQTLPLQQAAQAAQTAQTQTAQVPQPSHNQLFLYSTTVSDVGTVRANNQDSSFAGEHLVAICDGMGGHAGGDTASTIAIRSLAHIERDDHEKDVSTIATMMETSVMAAHDAIVGKARHERKLSGMGTTVTAVALVDDYWVLAHIGDSRAYLLRDGALCQVSQDHSYVQHLINTGRITEQEAKNHPQRNVVMRVLGDFDIDPHPDIAVLKAHPADRWLLCSDGLCGVLENSTIAETMMSMSNLTDCAQHLVSMALRAGSTDNVTAVIADATLALDVHAFDLPHQTPLVGGAASSSLEPIADIVNESVAAAPALRDKGSPAQRAAALMQSANPRKDDEEDKPKLAHPSAAREEESTLSTPDTGEIPIVQKADGALSSDPNDPQVAKAIEVKQEKDRKTAHKHKRNVRIIVLIAVLALLLVGGGAGYATYRWSQTRYYVGDADGKVAIFQGVPTNIFGIKLSHEVERTSLNTSDLPQTWRDELGEGITRDNIEEARAHVKYLQNENRKLQKSKDSDTTGSTKDSSSSSKSTTGTKSTSDSKSTTKDSKDTKTSSSNDSGKSEDQS